MLKIRRSEGEGRTTFVLSGHIDERALPELRALLPLDSQHPNITLDLAEVQLVDREAVGFLARCEAVGIALRNCPPYVRTWLDARGDISNEQ